MKKNNFKLYLRMYISIVEFVMNIIINNQVVFNQDEFTLTLVSQPENYIKLQPITSLVLSELLEKSNNTISREELLENIWVGRGYAPSNASLNNSIAAIRKSYHTLTNDELHLKTIPKVGYEFYCDKYIDNNNDHEIPDVFENKNKSRYKPSAYAHTIITSLSLFSLVFFALYFYFESIVFVGFKDKPYSEIEKIGVCNIYGYNSSVPKKNFDNNIKKELNLDECYSDKDENAVDIYLDFNTQGGKYIFYTECKNKVGEGFEQCMNYKVSHSTR